ncbi:cupin domain-containing protein [Nitrosomonas sp.]|uniref:cupin domain-containing protein n=1 Tax=Nitrosomonas sp. TaxID=42353 RepID=UPI001D4B3A74|nr:cupin domain-containing protein [Nitrosomonas sp.]MBX3615953.1 cupin domain-containing protein [Nitrosomonas sp.]
MKKRYSLDPQDPQRAGAIESTLLEGLEPLQPTTQQRSNIREQLFKRIHASAAAESMRITVRRDQGRWRKIRSGVRAKLLDQNSRAFLLDIDPGASLPAHRHHEDEECVVLRGSASLGELNVSAGDYHLARSGSRHGRIFSETGALLYLRGIPVGHATEVARDLITAFLPGDGRELITVRAQEGEWTDLAPGVASKPLFEDGDMCSSMIRIDADAAWPAAQQSLIRSEECLLLEGDAFVGDTLLCAGDWQLAPAGTQSRLIASDKGALLFVRSAYNRINPAG